MSNTSNNIAVQLAAIRAQILTDQQTNAKRDDEALQIERNWKAPRR